MTSDAGRLSSFIQSGRTYSCWPPFVRMNEYSPDNRPKDASGYSPPICLIHNVNGWGYHALVDGVRELGVKVYGAGSPDGLVHHREVKENLKTALCVVHLKSSDAPGYALYEALAAGCPVVCTGRLIWRCKMQELLRPGKTCLTFDNRETHDGLTAEQVENDLVILRNYLDHLQGPELNAELGRKGRARLEEVAWNPERDGQSLREFMARNFPG